PAFLGDLVEACNEFSPLLSGLVEALDELPAFLDDLAQMLDDVLFRSQLGEGTRPYGPNGAVHVHPGDLRIVGRNKVREARLRAEEYVTTGQEQSVPDGF